VTSTRTTSTTAPRGRIGRLTRLPRLDGESYQQFTTSLRTWINTDLRAAAEQAATDQLQAAGADGNALDIESLARVLETHPRVAMRSRCSVSCQQMTWAHLRAELAREEEQRRAELEAYDRRGPGSVTLDPALDVPSYARHEVHLQPGGYVGDELGGYLFHYGTNNFYHGENDQDQFHLDVTQRLEPPEGRLERIVDLGCGVGQLTVALKERFPQAEVHGVDVGAPMVRYAHRRAVDLGAEVHFRQALAHRTGFDDGSVDLVSAYIMFHEVPVEVGREIVAEAYRILRPGGVFEVFDFPTPFVASSPYHRYAVWIDHVFNKEPWSVEFMQSDFTETLRNAGFAADFGGQQLWYVHRYRGVKPTA
jgi:ubiquinone/menaquinone biosynthesis C-methylase UbiE